MISKGGQMKPIRNANGKLVCNINEKTKTVEIVQKGLKTIICFREDEAQIVNT